MLNKDFVDLVDSGRKQQNLNDAEKGIIRVLDRGLIKQLRYLYDITKDPAVEQYGHRFLIYYQKKHGSAAGLKTEISAAREEPDDQQI